MKVIAGERVEYELTAEEVVTFLINTKHLDVSEEAEVQFTLGDTEGTFSLVAKSYKEY